jgi:hypothetical protein
MKPTALVYEAPQVTDVIPAKVPPGTVVGAGTCAVCLHDVLYDRNRFAQLKREAADAGVSVTVKCMQCARSDKGAKS